jgi:hypothetical protein
MNSFVQAATKDQNFTTTTNGMVANKNTADVCVDLYGKIGSMRGQNVVPLFQAAYEQDRDLALRIALWARDVRGGAGERQSFRDIMAWLEVNDPAVLVFSHLLDKVPEVGRWDDLLIFKNDLDVVNKAYTLIESALQDGNGLCAKWMPRKGIEAVNLRDFMQMTPKNYRRMLVTLTNVVETQMCNGDWDNINFNHVPSLAAARYKKAFNRNTTEYAKYVTSLVNGEVSAKVNAGAVYPYDVIKGCIHGFYGDKTERDLIDAQWKALPNYIGDAKILPIVDVSGSMTAHVGGNNSLSLLAIAISLGLYCSEKNTGSFKDLFLTFSSRPEFVHLTGKSITDRVDQMHHSNWEMSTNLEAAFTKILDVAKRNDVAPSDLPSAVLILSDMQFNACTEHPNARAFDMIRKKYEAAGYTMPQVVFWNLAGNRYGNVPVTVDDSGAILVSGFSPSIMKSVLSLSAQNFTPTAAMLETVMVDRYNWQ